MGCGDEKLSKYLTQTFMAHCNVMIYQQVTLSGDAEWPKVADAVIEAISELCDVQNPILFPYCLCLLAHEYFTPTSYSTDVVVLKCCSNFGAIPIIYNKTTGCEPKE